MKIVICASVDFTPRIKEVADILTGFGHTIELPTYTKKILAGEITLEEYVFIKETEGDINLRKRASEDLIKRYHRLISESDAILVLNLDKKGIKNYVGGNTLLEIGFAHVLDKKIFLYNPIPDMNYKDEIRAVNPVIINGDLTKINAG